MDLEDKVKSNFIKDPVLRKIAQTHGLDHWEWGTENLLTAVVMMEGAAIAIQAIYAEGRNIELMVHQSGTMQIWGSAFFQYQINPGDEVEVEHGYDWDDDPVVKQYECKNVLTLCWDEALEMFGE